MNTTADHYVLISGYIIYPASFKFQKEYWRPQKTEDVRCTLLIFRFPDLVNLFQPALLFVDITSGPCRKCADRNEFSVDYSVYNTVIAEFNPIIIISLSPDLFDIYFLRMIPDQQFFDRILILRPYIFMGFQKFICSLRIRDLIAEIRSFFHHFPPLIRKNALWRR